MAVILLKGGLQRALENAEERLLPLGLDIGAEEREGQVDSLARAVEDLPVLEIPPPPEGDGPRSDPPEREGHPAEGPALENSLWAEKNEFIGPRPGRLSGPGREGGGQPGQDSQDKATRP